MISPPELLDPVTFPELGVTVQVKDVKGSEATRGMLVVPLEQIVKFEAFVTVGLGFTVIVCTVGLDAVQPLPIV